MRVLARTKRAARIVPVHPRTLVRREVKRVLTESAPRKCGQRVFAMMRLMTDLKVSNYISYESSRNGEKDLPGGSVAFGASILDKDENKGNWGGILD